jgi:hypothetical protein
VTNLAPNQLIERIPTTLISRSGAVFYSGRDSFTRLSPIYILGLNPGGDPVLQSAETIAANISEWLHEWPARRSAYVDERWRNMEAGTCGMQPRVTYLLHALGQDPQMVPSSNVVFVRTATERELEAEKRVLLDTCWQFHEAVIDSLSVRMVICFGQTAGAWVRERLSASELAGAFREKNKRGWTNQVHANSSGLLIATLTHPSRADWRNPAADPSPMLKRLLS